LTKLRDSAVRKMGDPAVKVFDAQLLIAGDYQFLSQVKTQIAAQRRNAGFVYNALVLESTQPLRRSPDPYLRQVSQDIEAVCSRVLSNLVGHHERPNVRFSPDTILVGKVFSPGEILSYRDRKVSGFLVGEGGKNSHSALIARSLMIPVVLARDIWTRVENGSKIIVDGTNGVVILYPTDDDWTEYQKRKRRQGPALITRIKKLAKIPPVTADGTPVNIAANLELPGPVEDILAARKIPIGLYRTEFMYLEGEQFPDEEMQFAYYHRIAEKFPDTCVVLRTFDLGSDKFREDGPVVKEDNPALGWRGIRLTLAEGNVFKTQVRAILRASTHGHFRILLPMISDLSEVERARKFISQVMLDLRRKDIPFDHEIKIGVMVEVPAAALMADQLARRVDFMSIGTNDLTQYTMSADRNNARVANLYSPLHPAVLQLVKTTVDACKRHNIPVAVCGEAAGDLLALPLFVGLGVDQLSMNPTRIVDLCRLVQKIDASLVRRLVDSVLASNSQVSVTRKLQSFIAAVEKN
jgi:phosphotransferase system enzyme I (PtsI)